MADNNKVIVELGRVIKNRREYNPDASPLVKYFEENIVQKQGNSYIAYPTALVNDGVLDGKYYLTRAPYSDDPQTPNAGWEVFASGKHNFKTGEDIEDVSIATGSDFTNPDATKRAKVPTVGAVLDGISEGVFNLTAKTGDSYASLQDALTAANTAIPANKKKGGMQLSFVHSVDNKYVQARCMAQNFTTDVTQWQGVDDKPTAESQNLVKSGGVADIIGVGKDFGSSTPVTVPFEFEVGKSYYIRDNRPVSGSYTPIYVRETENDTNVLVTNLMAGKTYKYTPETAYHYVGVAPTVSPAGASDFTIYEANSVNGRLKTVEDNNNDIAGKLNALRNGSYFNVIASCIEFEQGSLTTNEGEKTASNYRIRTAGYLFVRQETFISLPADISSVGI